MKGVRSKQLEYDKSSRQYQRDEWEDENREDGMKTLGLFRGASDDVVYLWSWNLLHTKTVGKQGRDKPKSLFSKRGFDCGIQT